LEKGVHRSKRARSRKRQGEPSASRLKRIEYDHRGHGEQAEDRQPAHAATRFIGSSYNQRTRLALSSTLFDTGAIAVVTVAVSEDTPIMSKAKPIPDGVPIVTPMLVCRDAAAEIDFCTTTFGAVETVRRPGPAGNVAHAALLIGGHLVMIEAEWPTLASRAPRPDASSPVVIYVYVEDVDAVVDRALRASAKILLPVQNQFWGDRTGRIIDPAGHVWTISTRIEETSAAERQQRWSKIAKS
jgi:PhnB protein